MTLTAGAGPSVNMVGAFQVRVGDPSGEAEPSGREDALNAMVRRILRLRMAEGLSPVKRHAALERVAQAYADRMVREGFYGPEAPDGTTLRERIPENGGVWTTVSENLGWGTGPLAAHFVGRGRDRGGPGAFTPRRRPHRVPASSRPLAGGRAEEGARRDDGRQGAGELSVGPF